MNVPTLGELARQARLVAQDVLEDVLRRQRQNYLEGDFRRLGEILVDFDHATRPQIRSLLGRQGITVVECELCQTRYNALMFRGQGACLRCGRRLQPSEDFAPLTVEDAISGGGPQADRLLAEYRQRNPRLGRYEILGEVGRGGMGVIYKAWEPDLQRLVALKFLRAGYDGVSDEDRERFRREARAVARLRHEHIVQAYAIDEASGLVFMSMDFVPGVSLELLSRRKALAREQVVPMVAKIARALHYAHEQGIVHRDVKPQNVVVDRDGKPFLVDFGIAKNRSESQSLTTEGEILGSLAYMAPEYITKGNAALDRRCDVYALGVSLYECLSGKLPFGEDEDERLVLKILKEEPTPIGRVAPGLAPGLEAVVMKAIARDREQRYPTAAALADDLDAVAEGRQPSAADRGSARLGASGGRAALGKSARGPALATSGGRGALAKSARGPAQAGEPALGQGLADEGDEASDEHAAFDDAPPPPPARPLGLLVALAGAVAIAAAAVAGAVAVWRVGTTRQDALTGELRLLREQLGRARAEAAQALECEGRLEEAERAWGEAAELLPGDPAPLEARARLRDRRGDTSGAIDDRVQANQRRQGP